MSGHDAVLVPYLLGVDSGRTTRTTNSPAAGGEPPGVVYQAFDEIPQRPDRLHIPSGAGSRAYEEDKRLRSGELISLSVQRGRPRLEGVADRWSFGGVPVVLPAVGSGELVTVEPAGFVEPSGAAVSGEDP